MDDRTWRVVVGLDETGGSAATVERHAEALTCGLWDELPGATPSRIASRVFAYPNDEEEAERAAALANQFLAERELTATIGVQRWSDGGEWIAHSGESPPVVDRRFVLGKHGVEVRIASRRFAWSSWEEARRPLQFLCAASVALAILGAAWYVAAPGVASYQLGGLLTAPAVILTLWQAHRRLPVAFTWAVAAALAAVGIGGYVLVGGTQLWCWGQYAVLPLWLMIAMRQSPSCGRSEPWVGGPIEGPWGPP